MKRCAVLTLILGLVGSAVIAQQTATEPLTVVGPFYQLQTASGAAYTISGPPGTYQVSGISMIPGLAPVPVQITIVIPRAGDAPPPNPAPNPPPNPPVPVPVPPAPNVITGKMWLIMVCDTTSPSFAAVNSPQRQLWASATIGPALAQTPISAIWRNYDASAPLLTTTKWGKLAVQVGFPCMLIVDQEGNPTSIPMPSDEAGVLAAARKARGL